MTVNASDITIFGAPEPGSARPFSAATRAGGLVFVSGHSAPHDPQRGIHRGETPADEVRNALAHIAGILKQAGSALDRVVQMTMLITDPADYAACNAEYVKHFPGGLPARHTARFGVPTQARVAFACIALAGDDAMAGCHAGAGDHTKDRQS
ncbi:RidA family protein [Bosea sp. (in: a-proteobacteria)]|uniref:RidA family protein n=1 Tax=Bosea sp. (in: a-proteobacteria) TaxID=1871050 RepID=UPI0027334786|nr:RidA family protein [Bosea sp. (in: a-proteobacteria)]MDP3409550.1 RidA family protein [Bosea sp. (in: a-proteobacteria)]